MHRGSPLRDPQVAETRMSVCRLSRPRARSFPLNDSRATPRLRGKLAGRRTRITRIRRRLENEVVLVRESAERDLPTPAAFLRVGRSLSNRFAFPACVRRRTLEFALRGL